MSDEVFIWFILAVMYYISWQYSTIAYRATRSYIEYCLQKSSEKDDDDDGLEAIEHDVTTLEEEEYIPLIKKKKKH